MIDGGLVRRDISHCCAELKLPRVAVTCGKLEGLEGTKGGSLGERRPHNAEKLR